MPTGFGWEFTTQYQKCQWEGMEYRGREYWDALYEKVSDRIARITLNRPEKRNAFNDRMFNDLMAGLHQACDDPEVRVVIIRGAGPGFGSGHDLSSPYGEDSPPVHPSLNPTIVDYYGFERRRCGKYEDVLNYPKVTIAQVHGFCLGANQVISAMCDITIAAEDAQFGVRGFDNLPFGVTRWPGLWPAESNKAYGGSLIAEFSGKQAEAMGVINKAVPGDRLEEEVMKWAQALSQVNPQALLITKEWLNGIFDIGGMGGSFRSHYAEHLSLQYVRFRPHEVNLYKTKRDRGLKGFVVERAVSTRPSGKKTKPLS